MNHKWITITNSWPGSSRISQIKWCKKCGAIYEIYEDVGYATHKTNIQIPLNSKNCKKTNNL